MLPLHSLTLSDVLRENARSYPRVTAVVDGQVRHTYAEMDRRVDALARAFGQHGVGEGDRVAWLGQNSFRVLESLLACARVGAVLVPVNWRQSADEVAFILDDLTPRVVIWESESAPDSVVHAHEKASDRTHWVSAADAYETLIADSDSGPVDTAVAVEAPVLGLYTAAFDGRPNCALLSQSGIIAHDMSLAMIRQIEPGFVYLNSGPLFHVGTMMFCLATFHLAGTNVFMPSFDPREACRLVDEEECQSMLLFPPMDEQMVAANRDGAFDLTSLRAAAGSDEWNAMVTVDPSPWGRALGGYGQTEVGGMLTLLGLGIGGQGTHGRPSPLMQVRLVDEHGEEVPTGEVGEIVARGWHAMVGYHNRPELNECKQQNGWHHTGDLGLREPDGTLTFVGPKLHMIKSAGENIYPAEVERALRRHAAVDDCAVIGVPDSTWHQSVLAIVVAKPGGSVQAEDLIIHCKTEIASYKKPRDVIFVDAIPKRGLRPDYDVLDELHGGGGYPGG